MITLLLTKMLNKIFYYSVKKETNILDWVRNIYFSLLGTVVFNILIKFNQFINAGWCPITFYLIGIAILLKGLLSSIIIVNNFKLYEKEKLTDVDLRNNVNLFLFNEINREINLLEQNPCKISDFKNIYLMQDFEISGNDSGSEIFHKKDGYKRFLKLIRNKEYANALANKYKVRKQHFGMWICLLFIFPIGFANYYAEVNNKTINHNLDTLTIEQKHQAKHLLDSIEIAHKSDSIYRLKLEIKNAALEQKIDNLLKKKKIKK